MTQQDKEQLKLEIDHIFESGANEIRIFEMIKSFIERRSSDTMTTEEREIKSAEWRKNNLSKNSGSLRFSEREVDFAYLCGVFNTSGIDGLHTEIQRLKELGKEPHDIIEACRKQ